MNTRIRIRKTLGLSGEKFGQALGLKEAAISSIESRRTSLTEQSVMLVCRCSTSQKLGSRGGQVRMFNPTDDSYYGELAEKYGLSPLAIEVFKAYIALPADKRNAIEWAIDNMFGKEEDDELVELIKKP